MKNNHKMQTIRLQSSDLEVFELDVEFARRSGWIRSKLEEESGNLDEQYLIRVKNLNGKVLRKVIEWLVEHKEDLTEEEEECGRRLEEGSDGLFTWNQDFFDVEKEMLIELVLAANFLDIKELLEGSCQAIADLIFSRSPEDVQQLFGSPDRPSISPEKQTTTS